MAIIPSVAVDPARPIDRQNPSFLAFLHEHDAEEALSTGSLGNLGVAIAGDDLPRVPEQVPGLGLEDPMGPLPSFEAVQGVVGPAHPHRSEEAARGDEALDCRTRFGEASRR
jgi:hypothetical protein